MDTNKIDILLIEDSSDEAELTVRALKKTNAVKSVMHINNGEEALDFLFCEGDYKTRNNQHNPKLILLDLKMPRLNGIEVLRRIKRDERTRVIPTVVLTSSKEERDVMESYNMGANSYFVKPVDFEGFAKAMSDLTNYWLELNHPPNQL